MDQGLPTIAFRQSPQIDDPDISQAGGHQQPSQPLGVAEVTVVKLELTTFLIGKEGLDTKAFLIKAACLLDQLNVCDQVPGLFLLLGPPPNGEYRLKSG
jgi:hypothetical protein